MTIIQQFTTVIETRSIPIVLRQIVHVMRAQDPDAVDGFVAVMMLIEMTMIIWR